MKSLSRRAILRVGGVSAGVMVLAAACGETETVVETVVKEVPVERIVEVVKEVPVEIIKEVEVEVAPAAPAQRQAVELRLTFWGTIEDTPTWQRGIDFVRGAYPHITIKWEDTTWGEFWTKLQTQVSGGNTPDITGMVTMYVQQYIRQNALMPLSDLVKVAGNIDVDDFWPANFSAYKDPTGEYYGFPYDLSTMGIFYNSDILEESGVPLPEGRWTWDDFADAVRKTAIIDGDRVDRFGSMILMATGWTLDAWLRPNGAGALTPDGAKSALSTPESIRVFQDWSDLMKDGLLPTAQEAADTPLWEIGKTTFRQGVPSLVQTMKERVGSPHGGGKFPWDIAYIPDREFKGNSLAGGGFSIFNNTPHPEEAWEFLSMYTSSEVLRVMIGEPSRGICGRESCGDAMLTPENPTHQKFFLDNLAYAAQWAHPAYNEISAIQGKHYEAIMLGEAEVEPSLQQADDEINPLLEEAGPAIMAGN